MDARKDLRKQRFGDGYFGHLKDGHPRVGDYLGPYLDELELDSRNLGKHMTSEQIKSHLKAHLLGSIGIDAWLDEIMNHMNNALGDAIYQTRSNKYLTA